MWPGSPTRIGGTPDRTPERRSWPPRNLRGTRAQVHLLAVALHVSPGSCNSHKRHSRVTRTAPPLSLYSRVPNGPRSRGDDRRKRYHRQRLGHGTTDPARIRVAHPQAADRPAARRGRLAAPQGKGNAAFRTEEEETAHGPADYALWLDDRIVGIVEAKKLTIGPQNVLTQAERYARGLNQQPRTTSTASAARSSTPRTAR